MFFISFSPILPLDEFFYVAKSYQIENLQFSIIPKRIIEYLYWFWNIWNDFTTKKISSSGRIWEKLIKTDFINRSTRVFIIRNGVHVSKGKVVLSATIFISQLFKTDLTDRKYFLTLFFSEWPSKNSRQWDFHCEKNFNIHFHTIADTGWLKTLKSLCRALFFSLYSPGEEIIFSIRSC